MGLEQAHQSMKKEMNSYVAHCLLLALPAQGHISPVIEFSKRLEQKGVRITLACTRFFWKSLPIQKLSSIALESISDGFDEGGPEAAESVEAYNNCSKRVGQETLAELLDKLASSGSPVDCVVYDAYMPWALDVAKKFGLFGAVFFTQPCAVNNIYFHAHQKLLKLPLSEQEILLPGLPPLAPWDLPSFLYRYGSYPVYLQNSLDQFSNIGKADWVLVNTFYELEQEVVEWMMKIWPLKTIGPTVPSMFLDKRIQDDTNYGISLFKPNNEACMKWLDDRPKGSVVYVSFGSMAGLSEEQMAELAWGLRESGSHFLWVVRESEEPKLPKGFVETSEKGLIVRWCPQLQVLSHEAVGCFVTHCGWNSTLEALSFGVPMVAMPQWTDQNTNAKFITDVWKMGLKAPVDDKGNLTRQVVKHCIKEIMESGRGNEMKNNAINWRNLARNAVDEGGSSDKNIQEFVAKLVHSKLRHTCNFEFEYKSQHIKY